METKESKQPEKAASKGETITIKKETLWKYSTFVLAAVVIVMLVVMFNGRAPTGAVIGTQPPAAAPTPTPAQVTVKAFDPDEDYFKGDADAEITIYEWSDFQCPFCSRFYSDALPQIMQNWVDSGKAKFVYRDFPLSFHPEATPAALAAECAGEQGKFWEMHDLIFENQALLSAAQYSAWASQIGLDMDQFESCYSSQKYNAEIQADMADGTASGIRGTPGFVIEKDGKTQSISGAQPYAAFDAALSALA